MQKWKMKIEKEEATHQVAQQIPETGQLYKAIIWRRMDNNIYGNISFPSGNNGNKTVPILNHMIKSLFFNIG